MSCFLSNKELDKKIDDIYKEINNKDFVLSETSDVLSVKEYQSFRTLSPPRHRPLVTPNGLAVASVYATSVPTVYAHSVPTVYATSNRTYVDSAPSVPSKHVVQSAPSALSAPYAPSVPSKHVVHSVPSEPAGSQPLKKAEQARQAEQAVQAGGKTNDYNISSTSQENFIQTDGKTNDYNISSTSQTGGKTNDYNISSTSQENFIQTGGKTNDYNISSTSQENFIQKGGEQVKFSDVKNKAHIDITNNIDKEFSKYENINTSDTETFFKNIDNKINEMKGGEQELTSEVSTEQFLNYLEKKINDAQTGGSVNKILKDSFIEGINKGDYIDNDTITQQDIINRIRMSGGRDNNDSEEEEPEQDNEDETKQDSEEEPVQDGGDTDEDDSSSDDSDDSSESDKSSDSEKNKKEKKKVNRNKLNKKNKKDDSSSSENEDSSESDTDESDNSSSDSDDDENLHVRRQLKKNASDDSLSSIIISSENKSITPYMLSSSSLNTNDINLVSFSPKHTKKNK